MMHACERRAQRSTPPARHSAQGESGGKKWGTGQGGEKGSRRLLSAPLPLLAQEDPQNEVVYVTVNTGMWRPYTIGSSIPRMPLSRGEKQKAAPCARNKRLSPPARLGFQEEKVKKRGESKTSSARGLNTGSASVRNYPSSDHEFPSSDHEFTYCRRSSAGRG
eukprot:3455613-Pyramimonas_sp.AAC.2